MIGAGVHTLVDRHFAGQTSPGADRRLFRHLPRCESCRAHYRTHAMLEELGGGEGPRARLARGLFAPAGPRWRMPFAGAALAALATACILLVLRPRDDIQARGGFHAPADTPALTMHRVPPGGSPERVGAVVNKGDALAFSYLNPGSAGFRFLMVFAYDDDRRVYWFWPAWQDGALDPTAIPIAPAPTPVELGEAVRHPLGPGHLTVVGLFSHQPLTVRAVEAAVAGGSLPALGGALWTENLEVLP